MHTLRVMRIAAVAVAALAAASCVSVREQRLREFDSAPLPGMVYDSEQKPCAGALVIVDGREGPRTDLNGRFVIDDLARGEHTVRVVRTGYEPLETQIRFLDRTLVLYLRVASHGQLLREAEEALARRELQRADGLLARAEALDADDPVGRYLRAWYHLGRDEVDLAVRLLEGLLASGLDEPAVYLTLADISEYRLGDPAAAARHLREYLLRVNSPEVRARLDGLKG